MGKKARRIPGEYWPGKPFLPRKGWAAGSLFFAKNRAGQTLFCSSNLPHNHGLSDESEMLGKTDFDLTPGPLAEKYIADDAEIYRTGEPLPPVIEVCLDHVGLPNWYRTCKYPIKSRTGEVIGIMGTFQLASIHETNDPQRGQLETARLLISNQLECFPGVTFLAACSKMSPRNFQRTFTKLFGFSPQTYWIKLRIRAACDRIRESKISLLAISSELGFYDQSSFTKHFRKHVEMTPHQFAKSHKVGVFKFGLT